MPSARIAVLFHQQDNFSKTSYLLKPLIGAWHKAGIDTVLLRGLGDCPPARALFQHVNLTVLPKEYLAFSQRYPLVINGGVEDISKRRVSCNLLDRSSSYQGAVIVKTDANFGGQPERRQVCRKGLARLLYKVRKHLPWSWSGYLKAAEYPIFADVAQVPAIVWRNPRLVVEKFLPEREGPYYALRQWAFFGKREICQRVLGREPVVKANDVVGKEFGVPVPESLRRLRRTLAFDYGKFDFVLIDGEAVLLDANRTPTMNMADPTPQQQSIVEELAQGIFDLVPALGAADGRSPNG